MFLAKDLRDIISLTLGYIYFILPQMLDNGLNFYAIPRKSDLMTEVKVIDLLMFCLNVWLKFPYGTEFSQCVYGYS